MKHWAIFDYGEVISRRTAAIPELAALLGVDSVAFEAAYWKHRAEYDKGIPDLEYWQSVGADAGASVDEPTSVELTKRDVIGWSETEPSSVELVSALDEAGIGLALLSNAPVSFARFAEQQPWTTHFRCLLFSGDIGIAKPAPAIFTELLSRLEAAPSDCLFFDDRQENVDAAAAIGIRAHRWLGAEDATAHFN